MRNVTIIAVVFLSLCCASCSCEKEVADGGKNRVDFYCNYAQCRVPYDEMYPKGMVKKIVEKKYEYQEDADTSLWVIEFGPGNQPLRAQRKIAQPLYEQRKTAWEDSITWTYDEEKKISEMNIVSVSGSNVFYSGNDREYIIKYGYDSTRLVRTETYKSMLDVKYCSKYYSNYADQMPWDPYSKYRGMWYLESIDTFIYNKEGLLTEIAVSPILPVEQKKYTLTYRDGFLSKIQNSTSCTMFNKEGMETSNEYINSVEEKVERYYIYNKKGKKRKPISSPTPQDINDFIEEFLKECKGKKADDNTVFVDYLYDEYGNWVVKVAGRESVDVKERKIYYWK